MNSCYTQVFIRVGTITIVLSQSECGDGVRRRYLEKRKIIEQKRQAIRRGG